ncbi:hypothetical protein [Flavobacterium gilvum]|uniref:Uncharacterized protein n=1 Tax=Flavobacterium gilvum TaxID=1492737 RepID=A0AAC9N5C1_9FLAO|nr:hypothetical protein [Flavobacterium gilvum]AOW09506.1 hypothetical protein EM308_08340 [Flavobacterium gilvum]KFC60011.1 hypothetical protein FEM08_11900 [Flavobacterium gilvum]
MITIFDFNPTPQELIDIRFDALSLCQKFGIDTNKELTPELYKELVSQENAYYDLAVLFEFRNDQAKADEYWAKHPKSYQTDGLGFDCLDVAI